MIMKGHKKLISCFERQKKLNIEFSFSLSFDFGYSNVSPSEEGKTKVCFIWNKLDSSSTVFPLNVAAEKKFVRKNYKVLSLEIKKKVLFVVFCGKARALFCFLSKATLLLNVKSRPQDKFWPVCTPATVVPTETYTE